MLYIVLPYRVDMLGVLYALVLRVLDKTNLNFHNSTGIQHRTCMHKCGLSCHMVRDHIFILYIHTIMDPSLSANLLQSPVRRQHSEEGIEQRIWEEQGPPTTTGEDTQRSQHDGGQDTAPCTPPPPHQRHSSKGSRRMKKTVSGGTLHELGDSGDPQSRSDPYSRFGAFRKSRGGGGGGGGHRSPSSFKNQQRRQSGASGSAERKPSLYGESFSLLGSSPQQRPVNAPHGSVHRKTINVYHSSWEILFKSTYVASVVLVFVALAGDYLLLRRIGAAGSTLSLVFLAVVWHHRYGVASKLYNYWTCTAFVITLFGDEIVMTPPSTDAHMLSFLLYMLAYTFLAAAFWTPSVPVDSIQDSSTAEKHQTFERAEVPLRPLALLVSFIVTFSLYGVWYLTHWKADSMQEFPLVPAFWFLLLASFSLWRGLARIGYRSPTHVQARNEIKQRYHAELQREQQKPHRSEGEENSGHSPNKGLSAHSMRQVQSVVNSKEFRDDGIELFNSYAFHQTTEARTAQWAAVIGTFLLLISQVFLGIAVFWNESKDAQKLERGSYWGTYLYIALGWVGKLFICYSIPCLLEPLGSLTDEFVTPAQTDGLSLDILLPLPGNGLDAVQVAVSWYYLTSRGHHVFFAYPEDQDNSSIRFDTSLLQGYGPTNIGGAGPLVAAMYEELKLSGSLQRSYSLDEATSKRFHGVILCDGVLALPDMTHCTKKTLQTLTDSYLEKGETVGLFGRWVPLIGCNYLAKTGSWPRSPLEGRTVTVLPPHMHQLLRVASWSFCKRSYGVSSSTYRQPLENLRKAVGAHGKVIKGPQSFLGRGSPWDDSNAFCVDDDSLVTGRWSGDTFLLIRLFTSIVEERNSNLGYVHD
eukprot:gb/GECG01008112.1/.p1 GENE.gb/GECG01008112.1/~~gb/GECG01008112.1/.p1  ORF type:complete len:864 (+),score=86.19 gb/GECG01008112.1/:1-2592(+)